MKVNAALGNAGCAAGEGDQRRVVLRGVDGRQRIEADRAAFERALTIVAVIFDNVLEEAGLLGGVAQVADETAVA